MRLARARELVAATPDQAGTSARALDLFRAGRYDEAMVLCRQRLAEAPDDVDVLQLLAQVLLRLGNGALATLMLEQALRSRGDEPGLLVELGSALAMTGAAADAAGAFERALAADPSSTRAFFGLLELDRIDALERWFSDLARSRPEDPLPQFALANLLLETGREASARESFDRAVALDPSFRRRHASLGSTLAIRGQEARAGRMYRWGLALNPDDAELKHLLHALEGGAGPDRASDAYVAEYFDAFAGSFDEVLVNHLDYRAPQLIERALRRWLPESGRTDLSVLDAGCGTGLCGPLLRPFARRLVGVDLSARMLQVAEASGAYDELRQDELVRALEAEPGAYDVIVAADVLVYFGSLDELLGAVAAALRGPGLVALTVERQDGDEFVLRPSGRYAHSADYLRTAAARAGLTTLEIEESDLRLDGDRPVAGYGVVLRAGREPA